MNLNENLDYTSLIQTKEYKEIMSKVPFTMSFTKFMVGYELDLYGDLHSISINGTNDMSLSVLYHLNGSDPYYARVDVKDDELKKLIRQQVNTNSGIKLRVKCSDSGVDTFELIEIKEFNTRCNYGQLVCTRCGHNFRFDNPDGFDCCLCGGKVKQIFDFYNWNE